MSGLHETTSAALDAVATLMGSAAPARRFVSPGVPAADCEQLCAWWSLVQPAQQAGPPGGMSFHAMTQALVTVQRWAPTCVIDPSSEGDPAKASMLTAESQARAAELHAVWGGLEAALSGSACHLVRIVNATPLDPQGGYAGWQLTIQAEVEV